MAERAVGAAEMAMSFAKPEVSPSLPLSVFLPLSLSRTRARALCLSLSLTLSLCPSLSRKGAPSFEELDNWASNLMGGTCLSVSQLSVSLSPSPSLSDSVSVAVSLTLSLSRAVTVSLSLSLTRSCLSRCQVPAAD